MTVTYEAPTTPRLRGILHAVTAPVAVLGGVVLILIAPTPATRLAVGIFMLTSVLLFSISATYHVGRWTPSTKAVLRRLDHSNIFLIIAGTYTPLALMLMPWDDARVLLVIVWSGAIAGVLVRNFWLHAPRWIYVPIYLMLGWAAVFYIPAFASAGPVILGLIVAGGLLYTVGALVYAFKWPQFSETWFGFHELFHAFTIAAFCAHFAAVALTIVQYA